MRCCCYALVALAPFYLLIRAQTAWTPHPRFFPDDAFYARLCLPSGLRVYWHDFGLYRLLPIPVYALLTRTVMRAHFSPAPLNLIVLLSATVALVWSGLRAGLSKRRGALLAGVLLGSPLLLETLNFWAGTLNYALVLLLIALQLRASRWALRRRAKLKRGLIVTVGGALLALLTYEIALPFILATSALYVAGGWMRRLASVALACAALVAFVAALAASGLYWPARFKLLTNHLGSTNSATTTATITTTPKTTPTAATATTPMTVTTAAMPMTITTAIATGAETATMGDFRHLAPPANGKPFTIYAALLLDFIRTGLTSFGFWAVAAGVAGLSALPRAREARGRRKSASINADESVVTLRELREGVSAESAATTVAAVRREAHLLSLCFAFALAACVGYLVLTGASNARYAAFLLIYGAASVAWARGRAATIALAVVLLVQAAVAAALPVHLRAVELAAQGQATVTSTGQGGLVSINGRLARPAWEKRFLTTQTEDVLTAPLNSRTCRYAAPCEACR